MILIIDNDAEMGIDMFVVLTVVFMAGGRDENRVQVQYPDAQVLEIIQFIDNSLDVSAVEAAEIGIRGDSIPFRCVFGMADGVIIFIIHHIIGRIAIAEAIHEDLVLHGTFCPVRHMKAGNEPEGIDGIKVQRPVIHNPGTDFIISDGNAVHRLNQETIDDFIFVTDNFCLVVIEKVIRFNLVHQGSDGQRIKQDDNAGGTVLCDPKANRDTVTGIRLRRRTEERGFIMKDRGKDVIIDRHKLSPFNKTILS